ncbi:MAG TPA: hypothetical protein VGN52_06910 [Burkholderiales bacterium]|jgi:hypothetical protein
MTIAPKTVVALPWFHRQDYAALRASMRDAAELPEQFADWEATEAALEEATVANGTDVQRVMLEPAAFDAWCRAHSRTADAQARHDYAHELVRTSTLAA